MIVVGAGEARSLAKAKSLTAVIGAHGRVLARQNEAEADGRMMAD
jgi:hypothetical protein